MLPIALHTNGRRALVAGGGNVAARKAETLHAAGFHLHVVAPDIDVRIRALLCEQCTCAERTYDADDLRGMSLAIAATCDPAVNARVVDDARGAGVLVCDASAPDRGDFTMQATVRVGGLTFSVDSGGSTPAFSKRLAQELSDRFDLRYARAAETLARMRVYVQAVCEPEARSSLLGDLAAMPIDELAAMNPVEAEHVVEATIERLRGAAPPNPTGTVVCASRTSALAMTQTRTVAARLAEHGIATTILNVTTTGDRVQDRPVAAIGSINVFVKELELALRERRADYAVHSCKDLPGALEPDMALVAISTREDPRDAFCSERYASFADLPADALVGTSSPRRRTQLQALRPDLRYDDIRGNVDTRLRKLRDGDYDAIVIAMAGLNRLRLRATHTVPFSVDDMVPAVAQGALAIEMRRGEEALASALRASINDEESELCVACERAALRALRAGCNAPLGVYAQLSSGTMTVHAAFAAGDDGKILRKRASAPAATIAAAEALGERIGLDLAAWIPDAHADPAVAHSLVVLPRTQERPSKIAAELRMRGIDVVELRAGTPHGIDREPDMLVFASSGSVEAARDYLRELRSNNRRPLVAAMGPTSAEAANRAGFAPDIIAPEATIDAFVAIIAKRLGE